MKTARRITGGIVVGLSLLYPAAQLRMSSHAMSDKAMGVKPKPTPDEQKAIDRKPKLTKEQRREAWRRDPKLIKEATQFFGEDPRVVMERPENQKLLEQAIEADQQAVTVAALGLAAIVWGLWPFLSPFVLPLMPGRKSNPEAAKSKELPCDAPSGE